MAPIIVINLLRFGISSF